MNNFPLSLDKGRVLFEKYIILKQIKKTKFLQIYLGKNIVTNELIIIKIEQKNIKKKKGILEVESNFLNLLKSTGIPIIKQIGYYDYNNIISIQANLGYSLSKIFDNFYRCFSIKDITMIAIQILERIKFIHSKNIIHCNINPDNLFIDFSRFDNVIYLTGFDHAIKYNNMNNKQILNINKLYSNPNSLIFSSMNIMEGNNINKKDDLESLGYILLFLLKGELPWEFIANDLNEIDKTRKIYQLKKYYSLDLLCDKIPEEFKLFINYIKELKVKEEIDYNYCFNLFYTIFKNNNIINDGIFSWYQEKRNNKNKNIKSYYEYLRRKKFLQNSISSNNLLFKYYDENGSNQINFKKSNSCFLKVYNFNSFKNSKKIIQNNITNLKINCENNEKNSISLDEEKEYSIEGEIGNEENLKTYKKKKAKKIIKRKFVSFNQNNESIYKTKNNSKTKLNNLNSYNNEKQLYTDYMIKRLPYIKIKKEQNKIRNKSKIINTTFKDINQNMKKKLSLNIKDLFSNNNNQKVMDKSFKSENISVKKLANKTKELKIGKMIRVSKKKLNQIIKLENKSIQENNITNNEAPTKKIIKRNIYSINTNKPEYTISSYNNKIKKIEKPKVSNIHSNKILKNKNNNIYPYSYNISKDNLEYNLNLSKIKKNSFTIIHNSISKLNLIQNISNIYVTKSYFEEPKNVYIKPKNINANKGKIKNMILKIKENKSIDINKNIETKSEKENSLNYYYL